jgi:signal recognition particle receptor subunit beta
MGDVVLLTGLPGQNRWHRVWQLGGTGFGQTALPFLALCVGVLIDCMHHGLNVHTLVLHLTVAKI